MNVFSTKSTKVALILGGGGFIGTNLAEYLVDAGYSIISVSKSLPLRPQSDLQGIQYVAADLGQPEQYGSLLKKADCVVYLASATTPGTSIVDPQIDVQCNLLPFMHFLRLNAEFRLPVIFASSGGTVYGPPRYLPIDEGHRTEPISPYGIAKLAMEKYLGYFSRTHDFRYTILRIANPYGGRYHRHKDQGVIDVFAKKIVNHEDLVIWGTGAVIRDYVHISDVCRSFLQAMRYSGKSTVFNIGSGQGRSILDIVDALSMHADLSPRLKFSEGRNYDISANVLDISHAESELEWKPLFEFNRGIAETLRNVK